VPQDRLEVPASEIAPAEVALETLFETFFVSLSEAVTAEHGPRKEPVANRDLWERLLEATQRHHEVRWKKVKGHSKTQSSHKSGNDRANELAVAALNRAQHLRSRTDLNSLYQEALLFEKRDFARALSAPGLSVISEIKRASPSAGFIRDADPAQWGARYELEGAGCLSVLTEPESFQGSIEDLDAARNSTTVPVLRKDFTVDEAQILETGTRADAVLVIAALFEAPALARHVSLAVEVGLTPLVEIHDEVEANLALESGARVIGVNNRDLGETSP
jgi:indole-3-glycerol phosphate synthase